MPATAGVLRVDLIAKTGAFENSMRRANKSVTTFGDKTARTGKRSSNFNQRMVEGSRAIDDISAGFATAGFNAQGFSLALRGAQNNVTTMIAATNPLLAALAGIGFAAGAILVKRFAAGTTELKKMATEAEKTRDLLKESFQEINRIRHAQGQATLGSRPETQFLDPGSSRKKLLDQQFKLQENEKELLKEQAKASAEALAFQQRAGGGLIGLLARVPEVRAIEEALGFGRGGAEGRRRDASVRLSENRAQQARVATRLKQLADAQVKPPKALTQQLQDGFTNVAKGLLSRTTIGGFIGSGAGFELNRQRNLAISELLSRGGQSVARPVTDRFAAAIQVGSAGSRAARERGAFAVRGQDSAKKTADNTKTLIDLLRINTSAIRDNVISVLSPVG